MGWNEMTYQPRTVDLTLSRGWAFHRVETSETAPLDGAAVSGQYDVAAWQQVSLPHTVKLDPPTHGDDYFKGVCWYRKVLPVLPSWQGKQVSAIFDGAMQQTEVWINGKLIMTHQGGYLPLIVDLTPHLAEGNPMVMALRLDNRASADVPPGSDRVDFAYLGGLYRPARLVVTELVHLTEPLTAGKVAGGGVFVRYENVTKDSADILAQANVRNEGKDAADISVDYILKSPDGRVVAEETLAIRSVAPGGDADFKSVLKVNKPALWHPDHPSLYQLTTVVRNRGVICDRQETRCGIRTLAFTDDGFFINGEKLVFRGANRHMSFPWIGNAASDNMQYRDIRLLKEAGFNFVRLAHYPQSTAVMEACDELGMLAIVCTPGWQFFGKSETFQDHARQNIRDMIRWHRNHTSAIMWEVSLNETYRHDDFYAECADIARAEYPGGQMCTSGDSHNCKKAWCYEVTYTGWEGFYSRPLHPDARIRKGLHREYGDYEFGGQDSTTRVPLSAGEENLMLQAWNFQWTHNKNLSWPWTIGDAIWAGIDCTSKFDVPPDKGSRWGALDLNRLPKFSYYFYQSQRDPDVRIIGADSGPMVRIAGYWTERPSPTKIVVYSNGDEVELFLNGKSIGRRKPDSGPDSDYGAYRVDADPMYWVKNQDTFQATADGAKLAEGKGTAMFDGGNCRHLAHPPFTFVPVPYEKGELKAVAYRNGSVAAEHVIRTPGAPAAIRLRAPLLGREFESEKADSLFVYAEIVDAQGEVIPDNGKQVQFSVTGPATLATPRQMQTEAGIASTILLAGTNAGMVKVTAESEGLKSVSLELQCR